MKYTILCLAAALMLNSCIKKPATVDEIDKLPPKTQEGRNTFGCLINGKAFVPGDKYWGLVKPISCNYYTKDEFHYIRGSLFLQGITMLGNEGMGSLAIQKMDVYSKGTYSIPYVPCSTAYRCDASFLHLDQSGDYVSQGGVLKISRLDTLQHIVSGTFDFTVKGADGKNYAIIEGRFDLKMEK